MRVTFEEAATALELVQSGVTRREVARQFGVSHTHLGRVLKQCADLGKDAPLVNVDRLGRPRTVPVKDVKRAMVMRDMGMGYAGIALVIGYDADVLRKAVWHYDNQTKPNQTKPNQTRREVMTNKHIPPAVGEFALEQLASDRCTCCTCGYTWVKGQHGGHSCAQVMEVAVADLRARLAKYEGAEGRPVSTLAEQAQQIQRLQEGQESLILVRDDYKQQAHDYRARWASAISGGNAPVGAIEAIRAEFPLVDDADLDQETHHCEWAVQHDRKRLNKLLDGLKAQPSGVDERAAFEASGLKSAGSVWHEGCYQYKTIDDNGDEYFTAGLGLDNIKWEAWQARAALSAPSHGEQVREVVPEGKIAVTGEALRTVLNALVNAPHQIRELQATREPVALFTDNPINVLIAEYEAAHAAPSAGSQKEK